MTQAEIIEAIKVLTDCIKSQEALPNSRDLVRQCQDKISELVAKL